MKIAVVVPVHNGGPAFRECLERLLASRCPPDEVIVVDDASSDGSAELASRHGATVLRHSGTPMGAGRARNLGARAARSDVLLFIDADVRVHDDTVERVGAHFTANPELSALFGLYDDEPPHRSLVSLYKNLVHHFVHSRSGLEAGTFWTGCGAIRRETFLAMQGFSGAYTRPSIEDIELGVRLRQAGRHIWLCQDVQVTHLKRWTLRSWLRSDILDRAVPWSRLICSSSGLPRDLNLDFASRLSAVVAWAMTLCLVSAVHWPVALVGAVCLGVALAALNSDLLRFFVRRGGAAFAAGAMALHTLYYLYSSATFAVVWLEQFVHRTYSRTKPA